MSRPPQPALPQYSLAKLFSVWGAATVPMAALGWIANPPLAGPIDRAAGIPGTARILLLTGGLIVSPFLNRAWVAALPSLAEPPQFSWSQLLDVPQNRTLLAGAWWFYALFLLLALFNTVLGEELLFRGLLLPRMQGPFGNWEWVANGVLFGFYHLHQPWGNPGGVVAGALLFALPTKLFRSSWMSIATHSVQGVFFAVVLFPLVRGAT